MSPSFLPATPKSATQLCPHVQVSASTTTIKASKFLSPIVGENPLDLPQCLESPFLSASPRIRGLSDSELLGMPASSSHPLSRVSISPSNSPPSSTSSPGINGHRISAFRARSKSFGLTSDQVRGRIVDSPTSPAIVVKWRNLSEHSPKPDDLQSGTKSVSVIDKASFDEARKSVAKACLSALGTAALVAREGLLAGLELAEAAPFPALQPVASTLLAIWDAVQTVSTNQAAFFRLTQRCGNIMISIQQDITTAGGSVGDDLELPLAALQSAFHKVQALVDKQNKSPFLKRYLKRDEIIKQIAACGDDLIDALQLFGTSVQIRALKAAQEMAEEIRSNSKLILNALNNSRKLQEKATKQSDKVIVPTGLPPSASLPSLTPSPITNRLHDAIDSAQAPTIICALKELHSLENASDVSSDREYLCTLVSEALDTCSDAELVSFLQIARDGMPEAMKSMQRELESGTGTCEDCFKDALHKKFIESGIDAIRRLSSDVEISLPSWTITEYEVDLEKQIGIGCFSDVFKGTWNGKAVAIKVLTEAAPPKLFVREMAIWKTLNHPNVLELYGASSATANPPWFFVSPYMKNGSLVEYLKRIAMEGELGGLGISASRSQHSYRSSGQALGEDDTYRFMQEIAKGMEYLHSRDVLHGDLKASNVLVDDNLRCVISDFGLSEIKNEAFRITGVTSHGTLRWQSPELMAGLSELTPAVDVYAYAISCIEILTMGRLPWALLDDNAVRYFILKEKTRPQIPENACSPSLRELLQVCWNQDPSVRPSFSDIVSELHRFRRVSIGRSTELTKDTTSPRIRSPLIMEVSESEERQPPFSPDLNMTSSPSTPSDATAQSIHSAFRSSWDSAQYFAVESRIFHKENTVISDQTQMPEPVLFRPSNPPSCASSLCDETIFSENEDSRQSICESHISPVPLDENSREAQNERKYRYLLDHKFHPSLILPLWTPSPVQLGDVGYLSKPSGSFVTLFNAFRPHMSSHGLTGGIPSIAGYGHVAQGFQRQDKRSAAQRGIDAVAGLLTFRTKSNIPISRRFSYPLKTGHKSANMCAETTEYQYMKTLDSSKAWFKANVDTILDIYGTQHKLHKDDVFLVIGALKASNYALFVSHDHPDGQVHFNVFSSPKKGQPWGTFTTDTKVPSDRGGPCYDEPVHKEPNSSSKVSITGGPQHGLLIARLRFKPDVLEPTSL